MIPVVADGVARLFLAIELEPTLLAALSAAIAPLCTAALHLAWLSEAKQHLTLKFLGDADAAREAQVMALMEGVARTHRPFGLRLRGIGAFPNFRRARVVWVGVEHETRLELLRHDVEVAGASAGFEIEGRAFRPHLTIARVNVPLAVEQASSLSSAARRVDFTAGGVSGITLFQSTLAPEGAHYRRVHVATFGGR